MTPTKDAAELSAERLAEIRGREHALRLWQWDHGMEPDECDPAEFDRRALLSHIDALDQRLRAASATERESWSIEAPEIGVELGADGSLVTLDRYGRTIRTLRAASAGSAWQPIATAPRGESWLLLYADIFGEPSVHAGFWSEGDWYDSEAASKPLRDVWAEPTHWQRFSAPTSQPAEEARCGTCDNLGAIKDPEKDLQIYGSDDYVPCPDCRPAEAPATAPRSAGISRLDYASGLGLALAILRRDLQNMQHYDDAALISAVITELERPSPAAAISEAKSQAEQMRDPVYVLTFIANAKRFDRLHFDDDTAFADWAQSLARHAISPDKETAR
jgi:hypothetical protein